MVRIYARIVGYVYVPHYRFNFRYGRRLRYGVVASARGYEPTVYRGKRRRGRRHYPAIQINGFAYRLNNLLYCRWRFQRCRRDVAPYGGVRGYDGYVPLKFLSIDKI